MPSSPHTEDGARGPYGSPLVDLVVKEERPADGIISSEVASEWKEEDPVPDVLEVPLPDVRAGRAKGN